jgi:hypothetical protein
MKIDAQFVLKIVQTLWGGSLTKVGSVVAIAGAAALTSPVASVISLVSVELGHPITVAETSPWVAWPLVAIGFTAVALDTYWRRPTAPAEPNPQDVALLRKFRLLFRENHKDFLRNHNFHGAFHLDALEPVSDVAEWRGASYEFADPDVEQAFALVKSKADQLDGLVALKTWPHRIVPDRQTALPDNYNEWKPDPQTTQNIQDLNNAARDLITEIDKFERLAKVRVPIKES